MDLGRILSYKRRIRKGEEEQIGKWWWIVSILATSWLINLFFPFFLFFFFFFVYFLYTLKMHRQDSNANVCMCVCLCMCECVRVYICVCVIIIHESRRANGRSMNSTHVDKIRIRLLAEKFTKSKNVQGSRVMVAVRKREKLDRRKWFYFRWKVGRCTSRRQSISSPFFFPRSRQRQNTSSFRLSFIPFFFLSLIRQRDNEANPIGPRFHFRNLEKSRLVISSSSSSMCALQTI